MKKIIAVIIACAAVALLAVCLVFGEDKKMNTYEHGRTLLSEEDMKYRANPEVFDRLYEYACTEEGADKKITDWELGYFEIESDGEGVAVRADGDCVGMHQIYLNMYFTEDYGKTWELHEKPLHLTAGTISCAFADGKLIAFDLNVIDYTSSVTVYDSKTREFTEYRGEELIERAGFSDCGVTELRLCADLLYKNEADGTVAVGWKYRSSINSDRTESGYVLIAEYSPDFELKKVLSLDNDKLRIYKTVQDSDFQSADGLLVKDRKLTEDDIDHIMKLSVLGIDPDEVVAAAKKKYEEKEDKTETDFYNLNFLGGWRVGGPGHSFHAPG